MKQEPSNLIRFPAGGRPAQTGGCIDVQLTAELSEGQSLTLLHEPGQPDLRIALPDGTPVGCVGSESAAALAPMLDLGYLTVTEASLGRCVWGPAAQLVCEYDSSRLSLRSCAGEEDGDICVPRLVHKNSLLELVLSAGNYRFREDGPDCWVLHAFELYEDEDLQDRLSDAYPEEADSGCFEEELCFALRLDRGRQQLCAGLYFGDEPDGNAFRSFDCSAEDLSIARRALDRWLTLSGKEPLPAALTMVYRP